MTFAASAPDVVTGIVAGGREEVGVNIAIGGLFGACLFTVTMVLAGCIRGAGEIEAEKKDLRRDIFFLSVAVLYFIVLTIIGEITPLLASGFLILYFVFLAYIVFEERRKKALKNSRSSRNPNRVNRAAAKKAGSPRKAPWSSPKTARPAAVRPDTAATVGRTCGRCRSPRAKKARSNR